MFSSAKHKITAALTATSITASLLTGLATPAHAATAGKVSLTAGVLTFTAGPDVSNYVSVTRQTINGVTGIVVHDKGAPVTTSGSYCTSVDANRVVCLDSQVSQLSLSAGSRVDMVSVAKEIAKPATIDGGEGGDDLYGGSGPDTLNGGVDWDNLYGGSGPDTLNGGEDGDDLYGGEGPDTLNGGPGRDWLDGRGGGDTFNGGPDSPDLVDYFLSPGAVIVNIDGIANDGIPGEGDNVRADVETIRGSVYDDTLTGDGGPNTLLGDKGADTLSGGGGDDDLSGGEGADTINGGPDVDRVGYIGHRAGVFVTIDGIANDGIPGEGDNVATDVEDVWGSMHSDTIEGSGFANELVGLHGNDTLRGRGGNDTLHGGAGYDILEDEQGDNICDVGPDGGDAEDCDD